MKLLLVRMYSISGDHLQCADFRPPEIFSSCPNCCQLRRMSTTSTPNHCKVSLKSNHHLWQLFCKGLTNTLNACNELLLFKIAFYAIPSNNMSILPNHSGFSSPKILVLTSIQYNTKNFFVADFTTFSRFC